LNLSIPLNGFFSDYVTCARKAIEDAFNSIEWIQIQHVKGESVTFKRTLSIPLNGFLYVYIWCCGCIYLVAFNSIEWIHEVACNEALVVYSVRLSIPLNGFLLTPKNPAIGIE